MGRLCVDYRSPAGQRDLEAASFRLRPEAVARHASLDCTQSRDWGGGAGRREPSAKIASFGVVITRGKCE